MQAQTFVDLVADRAARTPERTAFELLAEDGSVRSLSCLDLDRRARAVASGLVARGAIGQRVLILTAPGENFVVSFLGCLYAAAVAVPAAMPAGAAAEARILAIAADAVARFVLTDAVGLAGLRQRKSALLDAPHLTCLTADAPGDAPAAPGNPRPAPDQPAFLQYTSGSTGSPKGVVVRHDNLMHNSRTIAQAFGAGPDSHCVSWLPPFHDMGLIGGILQPLYSGFPCTLLTPSMFLRSPLRWLTAMSDRHATLSAAPDFAYLEAVRRTTEPERAALDLSSWEHAVVGAEMVRPRTLEAFARAFAVSGFRASSFRPSYGLAESTLLVTATTDTGAAVRTTRVSRAGEPEAATVLASCGPARGDNQVVVVDTDTGEECGPGQSGEIWTSGPSVAGGYWGRPEESDRVFRARLAGRPDREFLRTGDVGFLDDGELFVVGRLKDMMVIRGRNHHPNDIEETAEASHPLLRPARGAVFSTDVDGEEQVILVHEVERGFRAELADEVITAARGAVAAGHGLRLHSVVLVRPGSIPRTTSGKVMRSACRERWAAGLLKPLAEASAAPPPDAASEVAGDDGLTALVARAVGAPVRDAAGGGTPLVALGLDSLSAVRLASAVRDRYGVDVAVERLLGGMTPADLRHAVAVRTPEPAAEPERRASTGLASDGQRRMWLLDRMGAGAAYHVVGGVVLTGPVDGTRLRTALAELVRRHASLRTRFVPGPDDVLRATPGDPYVPDLPVVEVPSGGTAELVTRAGAALAGPAAEPFDLAAGRLVRATLFRGSATAWLLGVVVHHVAVDGWSLGLLFTELGLLYHGDRTGEDGRPETRPADPGPAVSGAAADFWRERLAGAAPVDLLPDRPQPPAPTWRGSSAPFAVPAVVSANLEAYARERGATPFMAVLAGLAAVLTTWTGQEDVVIGTPASARHRPGLENAVGLFVSLLPLRIDASGRPSFEELLDRVRAVCLASYPHQDLAYEEMVRLSGADRADGRAPLVRVCLALQDLPARPWPDGEVGAELVEFPSPGAAFELSLHLSRRPDGAFTGHAVWDASLFEPGTVASLLGALGEVLAAAVGHRHTAVRDLPLLSGTGRDHLVSVLSGRAVPALSAGLLHEAFEAAADRMPEAVALEAAEVTVSYGELEHSANRLAGYLRARGVGPDVRVAVHVPRSPLMVRALLAVLKAGGAYVPLDAEHPPARSAALLRAARPRVLLTTLALAGSAPPDLDTEVVCLDDAEPVWAAFPAHRPSATARGGDLALVVYTSGTSGAPKAVMTPHAGVSNRLEWMQREFPLRPAEAVLHKTSVGFDVSVWEIFWPLSVGARVVLARPYGQRDPAYLVRLIRERAITTCDFVPSMLSVFLAEPGAAGCARSLRRIFSNSEALSSGLVTRFREVLGGVELHNLYGPTETTIEAVAHRVGAGDTGRARVPVGGPIPGAHVYVLDAAGRPVPLGMPGEIHIGGLPVTRGYFERPAATAERFVPDPFSPGARLYRTGDRGRWLADGTLDFLGRIDDQVKIRGHRIEPAEVAAVLTAHRSVATAAVVPRPGPDGVPRLVAYVVPAAGEGAGVDVADLRSFVAERLPEAMVPSSVVTLAALPVGPNGKLARSELPELGPADALAPHVPPSTETELRLARIWGDLLETPRVSVTSGLLALGGHSLLAARIAARVRDDLGVELPIADLLQPGATIRSLAVMVGRLLLARRNTDELAALMAEMDGLSDEAVARMLSEGGDQ